MIPIRVIVFRNKFEDSHQILIKFLKIGNKAEFFHK